MEAHRLASWVLANAGAPITPLKLQKLLFYVYGAALAHDVEGEIGDVRFHAWKHGPVCVPVYEAYKDAAAPLVPSPGEPFAYGVAAEAPLRAALTVYGKLSPWQLREESHLEEPWRTAWERRSGALIEPAVLKAHFKLKFGSGAVRPPEHLAQVSSLHLDRIPVKAYGSLHELAEALSPPS